MNKFFKYFVLLVIVGMLFNCASMHAGHDVKEIDESKGYVAIYIDSLNLKFSFKNLDTNEVVRKRFGAKKGKLLITELPVGEYTVTNLDLSSTTSAIKTPFLLKSVFNVKPNSIVFLGEYENKINSFTNTYYLSYEYPWEKMIFDVEENLLYDSDFRVIPLQPLTIESKEESNFDFNL